MDFGKLRAETLFSDYGLVFRVFYDLIIHDFSRFVKYFHACQAKFGN